MLCMCLNTLLEWVPEGEVSTLYLAKAPKLIAVEEVITIEAIVASQLAKEMRLEDTSHYAKPLVEFPYMCHLRLCRKCQKP